MAVKEPLPQSKNLTVRPTSARFALEKTFLFIFLAHRYGEYLQLDHAKNNQGETLFLDVPQG
jgi:hypothetical protein